MRPTQGPSPVVVALDGAAMVDHCDRANAGTGTPLTSIQRC